MSNQMPTTNPESGSSFIGSKSKEYPSAKPAPAATATAAATAPAAEQSAPTPMVECPRCKAKVDEVNFCPVCGHDFNRRLAAKELGIEITTEDIEQYLFKGFIQKTVKVGQGIEVVLKTLQAGEVDQTEEMLSDTFKDKTPTGTQWENCRAKILLSFAWLQLNGRPVGKDHEERMKFITTAGTAIVERVGRCGNLLGRAIAQAFDEGAVKNS